MLASLDLAPEDSELGRYPLRVGDPLELEAPAPGLPADVREAEEAKRLRLAQAPPLAIPGGKPPELDQPRLLGRQLQVELREPSAKVSVKPLCVLPVLESHHGIVSEAHDHDLTTRAPAPPLMGPEVEDVVRINVGEQRRNRSPLRNAFIERRPRPILDDPRGHPLLDQPQDPLIRDPVLNKPLQPLMVKAGEVVPEIQVEHPAHPPLDPDRERVQRIVWTAPRPEPVGEAEEVRLID